MSDTKLLREYVQSVIVEKDENPNNVTQTLTDQQFDYRLNHGCPACGGDLFKRPNMTGSEDEENGRQFTGNFYVCRRNPDPNHYNLSIPYAGSGAREKFRGPKPDTRDAFTLGPKPNDGKNRVIRRRVPQKR